MTARRMRGFGESVFAESLDVGQVLFAPSGSLVLDVLPLANAGDSACVYVQACPSGLTRLAELMASAPSPLTG